MLPCPEPILAHPLPTLLASRLPWLTDLERRIVQAELQVSRHRCIVERLEAVGMTASGVKATARLAQEGLGLLQTYRQRLLNGGVNAQPRT